MSVTREEAITILRSKYSECKSFYDLSAHPEEDYPGATKYMQAIELALSALTLPQPSNEPLTLEELWGMDAPVWCSNNKLIDGEKTGYWCLCKHGGIITPSGHFSYINEMPGWVFYRRPPEGECSCQSCGGPLDAKPKPRKPRNCYGCKALILSSGAVSCSLGYEQTADCRPMEKCPKPRTNDMLARSKQKLLLEQTLD